jgi:hypothetical protein
MSALGQLLTYMLQRTPKAWPRPPRQVYARPIGRRPAMGQLLILVIIPPAVGVVTYALLRLLRKSDEEVDRAARRHQLDGNLH